MRKIDLIKLALDSENFDGYVVGGDDGVELSTNKMILSLHPDGTWTLEDFGIEAAAKGGKK